MSWRAVLLGTMDFILKEIVPSLIQQRLGAAVRTKYPLPKAITLSQTWIGRTFFKGELWRRGIHVPQEVMVALEDSGPILDVDYVIQEHIADRAGRHFDIRLVINGKSVSWAMPMKGKRAHLSRTPTNNERWAAIRQPDHTVEYNKFEGVIPEGNKGAGTVKIWASGKADILKIEDGNVHFRIHHGPARGDYVLVQTGDKSGLIIGKRPKNHKLWTKPRYTAKQEKFLNAAQEAGYVAENKLDGAAVELRLGKEQNAAFSHRVSRRTGQLIEHSDRLPEFRDHPVAELAGTTLRAEAWHKNGVNFLAGTLNSNVQRAREVQRENGPVQLGVFDITHYKGEDVRSLPYAERRALYEQVCKDLGLRTVKPVDQVKVNFTDSYADWVSAVDVPSDGAILKDPRLGYDEKPWPKVKPSDTVDCVVEAVTRGGPGKHSERAGALIVKHDGKLVHVGTGLSDFERQWIWDHRENVVGEIVRVDFHVRGGETTSTGPRFGGFHPDKSEMSLQMYADIMEVNPYKLKSSAGWRAGQ